MVTQFDFRLEGADAPAGELDADALIELVRSLKEVASKLSRLETGAEAQGRMPQRTREMTRLNIGLSRGSTVVSVQRTRPVDSLEFDLADEDSFDEKFVMLVRSLADRSQPDWMSGSIVIARAHLGAALHTAAPNVIFSVGGRNVCEMATADFADRIVSDEKLIDAEPVYFTGQLCSANLRTHRYAVEGAVGNRFGLPTVANDVPMADMLGRLVMARGLPRFSTDGRIVTLDDAHVEMVSEELDRNPQGSITTTAEIMSSAPGPALDGGIDLSDDEMENFIAAAIG